MCTFRTYPSIITFETLGLPNRNIHCIDAITNSRQDSPRDQDYVPCCAGLEDSPNRHNPASSQDASFSTETVSSQEG